MKRVLRLLPLIIFFVGFGCNKKPEGILPLNKMKVVFFHHIVAEDMLNNFVARNDALNFDSARTVLFSGVMKLHKTDSTTFARSMNYYKADIGRFKELLDSVNALALREKDIQFKLEEVRTRKKVVADSLAMADSLAKLKKMKPGKKDSLTSAKDTLKSKNVPVLTKKDSAVIAPR